MIEMDGGVKRKYKTKSIMKKLGVALLNDGGKTNRGRLRRILVEAMRKDRVVGKDFIQLALNKLSLMLVFSSTRPIKINFDKIIMVPYIFQ